MLLFSAACTDDSTTNTPAGTNPAIYELPATDADGITLSVTTGQVIEITTTGQVNTNPDGPVVDCDLWTDANGIETCIYVAESWCRGLPFMALIGFFDSQYFLVGTSFQRTFTASGDLTLLINDLVFDDNDGKFTVSVLIQ